MKAARATSIQPAYANALRYSLNFMTTHFFPALLHPASVCAAGSTSSDFKFYFIRPSWRLIKLKKNGHIIWQGISQTFAASEETGISFQAADRGTHRRRPHALVLTCPAQTAPLPSFSSLCLLLFFSQSQPSHLSLLIQGPSIPSYPIHSCNLPNIFHTNTLHSQSSFPYWFLRFPHSLFFGLTLPDPHVSTLSTAKHSQLTLHDP